MRLRAWLASIGSGAPHHFSRADSGTSASSTAASSAARPSCHTIAGASASPSTNTCVLTWLQSPTPSTAPPCALSSTPATPSETAPSQSSGACSTTPGPGREVVVGLDRRATRRPSMSNNPVLTEVVPTSTPIRKGPAMRPSLQNWPALHFVGAMLASHQHEAGRRRDSPVHRHARRDDGLFQFRFLALRRQDAVRRRDTRRICGFPPLRWIVLGGSTGDARRAATPRVSSDHYSAALRFAPFRASTGLRYCPV